MKIYTKTGDQGDTSLFGGKRLPKHSLRIDAYGTVDELNAHLGAAQSLDPGEDITGILAALQNQLFSLGTDLATPLDVHSDQVVRIQPGHVEYLEKIIDRIEPQLPVLQSFILPGGSPACAQLHIARTVCRRAERLVDALGRNENIGKYPLIYLNRLSDLLFILARFAAIRAGKEEIKWKGDVPPVSGGSL